jgi:hypothetical protein
MGSTMTALGPRTSRAQRGARPICAIRTVMASGSMAIRSACVRQRRPIRRLRGATVMTLRRASTRRLKRSVTAWTTTVTATRTRASRTLMPMGRRTVSTSMMTAMGIRTSLTVLREIRPSSQAPSRSAMAWTTTAISSSTRTKRTPTATASRTASMMTTTGTARSMTTTVSR